MTTETPKLGGAWFITCKHLVANRKQEAIVMGDPPEGYVCVKCSHDDRDPNDLLPIAASSLRWLLGKDHS